MRLPTQYATAAPTKSQVIIKEGSRFLMQVR